MFPIISVTVQANGSIPIHSKIEILKKGETHNITCKHYCAAHICCSWCNMNLLWFISRDHKGVRMANKKTSPKNQPSKWQWLGRNNFQIGPKCFHKLTHVMASPSCPYYFHSAGLLSRFVLLTGWHSWKWSTMNTSLQLGHAAPYDPYVHHFYHFI